MKKKYDYVVFGAGIFGMYSAKLLVEKGYHVALIEYDSHPFQRASSINQARLHNGYHYPRSLETAEKVAKYYRRFSDEFSFAINKKFQKIYAIANENSHIDASQFTNFCRNINIPAIEINANLYFQNNRVESAFLTDEYSFDSKALSNWFMEILSTNKKFNSFFNMNLSHVEIKDKNYQLFFPERELIIETERVVNATYASTNQILAKFNLPKLNIKYELCEMIIVNVNKEIKDIGLTVMDGPFFSLMPFGLSGLHSLSSVKHTPHMSSIHELPTFNCQNQNNECSFLQLSNCNNCVARPNTAWKDMSKLMNKFLSPSINVSYKHSLFANKAVLLTSELDDSRPTLIQKLSDSPYFISIFSGKFDTIYDLDNIFE